MHQLRVLLRASKSAHARLGGLPALANTAVASKRLIYNSDLDSDLPGTGESNPIQPGCLHGLKHLEDLRKLVQKKVAQHMDSRPGPRLLKQFLETF